MSSSQPKPAWLTDELADVDEWIDWQDESHSLDPDQSGSELSFTQPLGSVLVRNSDLASSPATSATDDSRGTFIVREDLPTVPLLPKTPGRNNKPAVKDFFSPLALEKMFEPPSPPHQLPSLPSASRPTAAPPVPSRLSQVHVPPSEPSLLDQLDDRPTSAVTLPSQDHDPLKVQAPQSQFTFTAPRPSPFNPAGPIPDAQSTPGPANPTPHLNPPPTDPRLRLFQFQYDTFTRDHLSAMVDSIAVNTPSGDGGPTTHSSQRTTPSVLSPVEESSFSRLRSAKRLKLSPASDFSGEKGDGDAIIMRPLSRRDYVGESRNLMDQIRQARDFSTVSTVATARSPAAEPVQGLDHLVKEPQPLQAPSFLTVPESGPSKDPSPNGTTSSKRSGYSSLGYRQQAASLMAQIRNDMKGSKRMFSGDTEASHLRNDDVTEASSIVSADLTVPSLRSRNGDSTAYARLRRPSEVLSQSRRPSMGVSSRVSSVSWGKQRAGSSPRPSPRKPSVVRPTHSAHPSSDLTREISEEFTRMSVSETSRMLSQFPVPPVPGSLPPPVRLVTASTSTAPGSPVRPSPGHLAPPNVPAYPSSSLRAGRNADLTRFVSSSTASGTTLTTGSADSFVKHAGPKQMVQITPNDVGALLADRVGKMVFDRVMMRWVKATALATSGIPEAEACAAVGSAGAALTVEIGVVRNVEEDQDNESEDPFRDIEIDEGDSMPLEKSRIEEVLEEDIEDEEEAELTSFSTDGPSHDFAQDVPIDDTEEDVDISYTESDISHDREEGTRSTIPTATLDLQLDKSGIGIGIGIDEESTVEPAFADTPPRFIAATPCFAPSATPELPSRINGGPDVVANTPAPRSVLKSASATPMSALKDPNRAHMRTPANKSGHRRSVSFSDGKREGPIVGIGRNAPTPEGSAIGEEDSPLASSSRNEDKHNAALVPSARSKRIAEMLGDLESTDLEEDSPSKVSTSSRPIADELYPLQQRRSSAGPRAPSDGHTSRHVFTASRSTPNLSRAGGNATFLTECSFGVAHDRLVQVITDVQPFEPYWEELTSIDLSNRNLDSTARLKEFLPRLDSLSL
uniref:Histidine kinase 1 n=1 Tax=Ganoderma boninense TaxID=34458 RepID=A0A5K1K447_9APHY|nr:Histidine kinase 1 [Ganoderma boninense]